MCGIAGVFNADGRPVDAAILKRMGDSLAHRGPDGEGLHADNGTPSAGLVSRRLAVIDVEGGTQPMTVGEGEDELTIVYNGEIFNAAELRGELERAGQRFRTRCDTEVVLRGYAEWGAGVLDRLNGMWALAIWHRGNRRLFCARDRLGVKPFVYARVDGGFVFGSEIKALIASGLVDRDLDPSALPHYLSALAVPEPYSLVRGVRRLPAGHLLIADRDGVREQQWWDCALAEEQDRGAEAYREETTELLDDAVRRRLVSDVPLGVLLSGGIDSRLTATLAANHAGERLRTFTLGFGLRGADEREPARAVAEALGADHHEELVTAGRAARELPELLAAYDEPGQSLVQTYFVSRLARRQATVALSGLGGDELFSSYPGHVVANLLARYDRLPGSLRAAVRGLARIAPSGRARRAAALAGLPADARATQALMHQTDAGLRHDLLTPDVRAGVDLDGPARHLEAHFERARAQHPLNRLLYVYLKTYLTDELLRATDAMSMWASLEVRTPFLDYRLVEAAMRMPARHKMRWTTGKLLLREIASRTLPQSARGVKRGFALPLDHWLRTELGDQVREALSETAVRKRGVFDPVAARRVLDGWRAGDQRLVPPVMMLYAFETWARRWLDGEGLPAPVPDRVPIGVGEGSPAVSVIVVNWNTRELLRSCMSSLREHLASIDHEVIVVDNGSGDGSAEMVEADFPDVRLIRNAENLGFGVANNQAMRSARGDWLLLVNSDTRLVDRSVADLVTRVRDDPDLGVAHCRLRYPDGRQQHTAYRFPSVILAALEDLGLYKLLGSRRAGETLLGGHWDYERERDVDWVAGAFMLLPREVFEQTGGFDERLFMYGEDMEWCQRIRDRGWRIRFFPQAQIVHEDHASSELRWGDERVALCLQRQRDIYADRRGPLRGGIWMAIRIVGGGLRAAWYTFRGRIGGDRAATYREMAPHVSASFRGLVRLAVRRR